MKFLEACTVGVVETNFSVEDLKRWAVNYWNVSLGVTVRRMAKIKFIFILPPPEEARRVLRIFVLPLHLWSEGLVKKTGNLCGGYLEVDNLVEAKETTGWIKVKASWKGFPPSAVNVVNGEKVFVITNWPEIPPKIVALAADFGEAIEAEDCWIHKFLARESISAEVKKRIKGNEVVTTNPSLVEKAAVLAPASVAISREDKRVMGTQKRADGHVASGREAGVEAANLGRKTCATDRRSSENNLNSSDIRGQKSNVIQISNMENEKVINIVVEKCLDMQERLGGFMWGCFRKCRTSIHSL
uniref:DUF4283 domain-containing protein n=1 Tax=Nelumbo nucifera TaxID=4432 RepID=A0A822Z454_NELNU|nr:TPA_asm: hypothetical protein HUJ06_006938 [Nelumbo nucifera]